MLFRSQRTYEIVHIFKNQQATDGLPTCFPKWCQNLTFCFPDCTFLFFSHWNKKIFYDMHPYISTDVKYFEIHNFY